MKKIYKTIVLISILILLLSLFYARAFKDSDEAFAVEAFKTLETVDFNEELYIFSTIPKGEGRKVETLWGNIITYYDMRSNNPIISIDKDGLEKEERQTDNGKIFVDFTKTDRNDSYALYVNINTSDDSINLQNSMAALEKNIIDLGLKYEVTLSIKGNKLGRLNNEDISNIKSALLTKCKANFVSEYKDKYLYNITGFSKDLGRFVRIGGKKVNLNIAIRYSETENKTYIYLATPIIRTEV